MKNRDRTNKIWFGIIIIFLMVSSTIGFIYGGDSEVKKVNGQKFYKDGGMWKTYIDSVESYWDFTYLPNELGYDTSIFDINSNKIYLYSEDNKTTDKFKFILLYKNIKGEVALEENCNLDSTMFVINSELTNEATVTKKDNCIYLNGNLNKFVDGLTYKVFGVL
nr:hypothetical protein [Nanoarchaeum sp.]